jgi:hypothetical protein
MQRRGESGQPAKEQRTTRPKARKAPTAHVSNAALQEELGRAMRERDEALEQLAATSGVLQVISSMPGDLEPVFQSILANAVRICEAKFGTLYRTEGDSVRCVAMHGARLQRNGRFRSQMFETIPTHLPDIPLVHCQNSLAPGHYSLSRC